MTATGLRLWERAFDQLVFWEQLGDFEAVESVQMLWACHEDPLALPRGHRWELPEKAR